MSFRRCRIRPLLFAVTALAALPVAAPLCAQDAPEPSRRGEPNEETVGEQSVESARRAREAFREAVAHFEAGRYVEAIHDFQVAASFVPSADLSFNIASAYQRLANERHEPSDFEQAIEHFRRYLRDRVDPPDRASVEASIRTLEEQLEHLRAARTRRGVEGTLRIESEFEGASVHVDGDVVGQTPLTRDLTLTPGAHRLEARREGFIPFVADVTIETGLTVRSRFDLTPTQTHRAIPGQPTVAWIVWGTAVAALGVSVGLGVEAANRAPSAVDLGLDPYADARTWSAASDAMLGVTVALTVAGIAVYAFESAASATVTERGGVIEEP